MNVKRIITLCMFCAFLGGITNKAYSQFGEGFFGFLWEAFPLNAYVGKYWPANTDSVVAKQFDQRCLLDPATGNPPIFVGCNDKMVIRLWYSPWFPIPFYPTTATKDMKVTFRGIDRRSTGGLNTPAYLHIIDTFVFKKGQQYMDVSFTMDKNTEDLDLINTGRRAEISVGGPESESCGYHMVNYYMYNRFTHNVEYTKPTAMYGGRLNLNIKG